MIYQIQYCIKGVIEVVDETVDAEHAIALCREYSMAFKYPCVVVREDEADFIKG